MNHVEAGTRGREETRSITAMILLLERMVFIILDSRKPVQLQRNRVLTLFGLYRRVF